MIDTDDPALRAFLSRDIGQLSAAGGLPEALPLAAVAAALGADPDTYVRWFLGDPPRKPSGAPPPVSPGSTTGSRSGSPTARS